MNGWPSRCPTKLLGQGKERIIDAGPDCRCTAFDLLRGFAALRACLRRIERKTSMILNAVLLIVATLLMVYLVYALLRPEKF
ncbi:MAG: K(+)-transporting ATPase subunit F [Janthinobacterium lividum]